MVSQLRTTLIVGLAVLVAACQTAVPPGGGPTTPGGTGYPPVIEPTVGTDNKERAHERELARKRTKTPEVQAGEDAAMLALLDESERAAAAGNPAKSISVLERALRIEPRRADLWVALARAHLRNDEPQRAVQFAQRGLALADRRVDWKRDAWLVIADAKSQLGREDEAQRIRRQWRTFEG